VSAGLVASAEYGPLGPCRGAFVVCITILRLRWEDHVVPTFEIQCPSVLYLGGGDYDQINGVAFN